MIHTFGILRKNASKGLRQLIQAPGIDQSTGSTRKSGDHQRRGDHRHLS